MWLCWRRHVTGISSEFSKDLCHFVVVVVVTESQGTIYHFVTVPILLYVILDHHSSMPLRGGIKPPLDQGPPLLLLSAKAILCYIYILSHGSFQVHSLVGGLDSGSTGWSGHSMLFFQWGCNSPPLPQSFCQLPHQVS